MSKVTAGAVVAKVQERCSWSSARGVAVAGAGVGVSAGAAADGGTTGAAVWHATGVSAMSHAVSVESRAAVGVAEMGLRVGAMVQTYANPVTYIVTALEPFRIARHSTPPGA